MVNLEKWFTLRRVGQIWKNVSHLEKGLTFGKKGHACNNGSMENNGHTWNNGSV